MAEQCVAADTAAPQPASGSKRKRSTSTAQSVSVETLAAKIKQLQEEADQEEAAVAKMEAAIVSRRSKAAAKRAEAHKVDQDYVRRQCEEALSKLEGSVPKRASNPFFIFKQERAAEFAKAGMSSIEIVKKVADLWANLGEEGKKVYKDRFDEAHRKWKEWGDSEEGRRILAERDEVLRKVKAAEGEQLAGALGSKKAPSESTPSKSRVAEQAEVQVEATPPKQRKVEAPVARPSAVSKKSAVASVGASLGEGVIAEAEKLELLGPLRNLAGRPEVRSLCKTDAELLGALKAYGGMVNSAKRALLGEA